MDWGPIETIVEKVGILAVFVFLAYVLVKFVAWLLADLAVGSHRGAQESNPDSTDTQEPAVDPIESVPGLHVLSDFGAEHRLVDKDPTEETIRATVRNLDWIRGFHQVLLVTSPGVSLEVGGSLDPDDGLASVYRDRSNEIFSVTREPPTTVENMEDLLISFSLGDGRWKQMYDYEQIPSSVT